MRLITAALLTTAVLLGGCSSREVLITKPAAVPAGVDLSGQWVMVDTSAATQPAARETLVYAFFESGKSVKVTQIDTGLFISFDRSVVEEYRFGENRVVTIGEISADRVSGWEGNTYVIETLDKDGAKLTDSYRVEKNASELVRTVSLLSKNGTRQLNVEQVFDRVVD